MRVTIPDYSKITGLKQSTNNHAASSGSYSLKHSVSRGDPAQENLKTDRSWMIVHDGNRVVNVEKNARFLNNRYKMKIEVRNVGV